MKSTVNMGYYKGQRKQRGWVMLEKYDTDDIKEMVENARSEALGECWRTVRNMYPSQSSQETRDFHQKIMKALDKIR
jgi:hypothetical protein